VKIKTARVLFPTLAVLLGFIAISLMVFVRVSTPASASAVALTCDSNVLAPVPSKTSAATSPSSGNQNVAYVKSTSKVNITYAAYGAEEKGAMALGKKYEYNSAGTIAAGKEFMRLLTTDPLWATTPILGATHGMDIDVDAAQKLASSYVANPAKWQADVKSFCGQVKSIKLKNYTGPYNTFGETITGKNSKVMPRIFRTSRKADLGQSLDVTLKSGKVLHIRTACDQLSQPKGPKPKARPTCKPTAANHQCGTVKPSCRDTGTCRPPKTCRSVYGPGYNGTYPRCHKDGTTAPKPPLTAPGTNPNPDPTNDPGSNECYSNTTGKPVQPVDGKCPDGSFGG